MDFTWKNQGYKKRVELIHNLSVDNKKLLGLKGACLCELHRLGLPIPPGFIITADTAKEYFDLNHTKSDIDCFAEEKLLPQYLESDYINALHIIEEKTGKLFGESLPCEDSFPLLLSVRASADFKVKGMLMDTILNLGMNDNAEHQISLITGSPAFALDLHKSFLYMFGVTILKIDQSKFDDIISKELQRNHTTSEGEMNVVTSLQNIVDRFKELGTFPDNPHVQLRMAIEGMFCSWYSERAIEFRNNHGSTRDIGVAIVVQAMVFGNTKSTGLSGSGIAFSRHPCTGLASFQPYGKFMPDCGGDSGCCDFNISFPLEKISQLNNSCYLELSTHISTIELFYKDIVAVSFVIENDKLYILDSKSAIRTPRAAVVAAVSMVAQNMITKREALLRLDSRQMNYPTTNVVDADTLIDISESLIGIGVPCGGGAVTGMAVFDCEEAIELHSRGIPVILIRNHISIRDKAVFNFVTGVLLMRSGLIFLDTDERFAKTKCVVTDGSSCGLSIDFDQECLLLNREVCVSKHQQITIDGFRGYIISGAAIFTPLGMDDHYLTIMKWADEYRRMKIYGNINMLDDVYKISDVGGDGVGACYTENLLLAAERVDILRYYFLTKNNESKLQYLGAMELFLVEDFVKIFRTFYGNPVSITIMGINLYELFANKYIDPVVENYCKDLNMSSQDLKASMVELLDRFPLEAQGCQFALTFPDLLQMQVRAILLASKKVNMKMFSPTGPLARSHSKSSSKSSAAVPSTHADPIPVSIILPGAFSSHEVKLINTLVHSCATATMRNGIGETNLQFSVGISVTTPRQCLGMKHFHEQTTGKISHVSLDTEHLTKLVYGICKRDSARIYHTSYREDGILRRDPFHTIDERGLGKLLRSAVEIRNLKSNVYIGASSKSSTNESILSLSEDAYIKTPYAEYGHAGDPQSIKFLDSLGLDYISCDYHQIAIAKVAAAQSSITSSRKI